MDLSAFNLQGKVALITGGAHGIGFSIAEGMAQCGATVCFNCSSEASLEKGLAAYKAVGIDAHGYVADVSDEDAVNAMVAKIKAEVGPVDILVNNAGLMKRVPMIEMSHADFMRVIDVHVGGAFNCSKAVLPDMMEKREGKIINICSMMSELGRETVSAYAAAKGGVVAFGTTLMEEVREYDPYIALDGGEDGLDFYRRIIGGAQDYLKRGGQILMEIGSGQAKAVSELLREAGFKEIDVCRDFAGLDRVVSGRLPIL